MHESTVSETAHQDLGVAPGFAAAPSDEGTAKPSAAWVGAELTLLTKAGGPLTKRIALDAAGRVVSDGAACVMAKGRAERLPLAEAADLAAVAAAMTPNQALALGRLRTDLPDAVPVATRRALACGEAAAGAVARARDQIDFVPGAPAFALLDFDRKGMPDAVAEALAARGGFWPALVAAVPGLVRAARVRRASTSAGLIDTRTGAAVGAAARAASTFTCWCGTELTSSASSATCTSAAGSAAWAGSWSARWASCSSGARWTGRWGRRSAWCSRARRCWILRSARTAPPARRSGTMARRSTPAAAARRSRGWNGPRWPN
jgi:hypothetical protein